MCTVGVPPGTGLGNNEQGYTHSHGCIGLYIHLMVTQRYYR